MANFTAAHPLVLVASQTTAVTFPYSMKVTKVSLVNAATTTGVATIYDGASGDVLFVVSNGTTSSAVSTDYNTPVAISSKVSGITWVVPAGSTAYVYWD